MSGRIWAERHTYTPPIIPPPVQKAQPVTFDVARQVKATKKLAAGDVKKITFSDDIGSSPAGFVKALLNAGTWEVHVTKAIGTWINTDGTPSTKRIMEEAEGTTPTGKPKMTMVGEEVLGPQDSVLVRALVRGCDGVSRMLWGHWVSGSLQDAGDWHRGQNVESFHALGPIMEKAKEPYDG